MFPVYEVSHAPCLFNGMFNELLAAESGIDGHEHDQIEIADNFFEHCHRSVRIEGDTGHHAFFLDLPDCSVQVGAGFVVHVHYFSTECLYFLDEFFRLYNHKMYVERFLCMLCHRLHDGKSERNIRDEYAVHNVEVVPVSFARVEHVYVVSEVAEIGR